MMRTQRLRAAALTAVLAAGLVSATAMAAHAEGSRNTYVGGYSPGADSSTWADSNGDNASTRVRLAAGATTIDFTGTPISYTPSSVQLQLQKDVFGVGFQSQGNKTAAPGVYHNWGDNNWSGTFRFQYNGSTAGGTYYGAGSPHALFSSNSTAKAVYIGW